MWFSMEKHFLFYSEMVGAIFGPGRWDGSSLPHVGKHHPEESPRQTAVVTIVSVITHVASIYQGPALRWALARFNNSVGSLCSRPPTRRNSLCPSLTRPARTLPLNTSRRATREPPEPGCLGQPRTYRKVLLPAGRSSAGTHGCARTHVKAIPRQNSVLLFTGPIILKINKIISVGWT